MLFRLLFLTALLILLYAGCGPSSAEKANKLVNDGNSILQRSTAVTEKADGLKRDLFGENLAKAAELAKYKSDNKEKFEAATAADLEASQLLATAALKYEEASKLTSNERFNEYLLLRSREFRLLSESYADSAAFVDTVLAESDGRTAVRLVVENAGKERAAIARAAELRETAEKVVRDNPSDFKSN